MTGARGRDGPGRARSRLSKKPTPQPLVVGARYCLAPGCGRLVMSTAMELDRPLMPRDVGCALSGCCQAHTALLLLPADSARDLAVPSALPGIVAREGRWTA
jgi:hypothetical protein